MLKLIPTKDDIITKLKIENDDCKALNIELKNKITKHEKVFEILKEVLVIPENDDIDWYDNDIHYYKLRFTNRLIKENEKELLEELMKNENIQ